MPFVCLIIPTQIVMGDEEVVQPEEPTYEFVTGIAVLIAIIEIVAVSAFARIRGIGMEMPMTIFLMSAFLSTALTMFMIGFHEGVLGAFETVPVTYLAHLLRDGMIGFDMATPIAILAFPLSQKIVGLVHKKPVQEHG